MFGVTSYAIYQLVWLNLAGANFVDGSEQGESITKKISLEIFENYASNSNQILVFHIFGFEHMVHFFSGDWTLQLLAIQHFLLQLFNSLASLYKSFTTLAVATTLRKSSKITRKSYENLIQYHNKL